MTPHQTRSEHALHFARFVKLPLGYQFCRVFTLPLSAFQDMNPFSESGLKLTDSIIVSFFCPHNAIQVTSSLPFALREVSCIVNGKATCKLSDLIRRIPRSTTSSQTIRPLTHTTHTPASAQIQRYLPLQVTALAGSTSACTRITRLLRPHIDSINLRYI